MCSKLIISKSILWVMVLFAFSFIGCSNSTKTDSVSTKKSNYAKVGDASNFIVQDYFPKKNMKKYFSGGFENGGFTQTIDKFQGEKVQEKQLDTGTAVASVYQVTDKDIRKIFVTEVGDGKFKDDYIATAEANRNDIILKAPLSVGTQWADDRDGKYEITGINVKVETSAGTFYTVEVTYTRGDYVNKKYYAKYLGLVKSSIKGYGDDLLIKVE